MIAPMLLSQATSAPADVFADAPVCPSGSDLSDKLPVSDAGRSEQLVRADGGRVAYLDAYARLGILPPRACVLREGAAARVSAAAESLPDGFGIVILDSWRTLEEQRALVEHYGDGSAETGFVAPVSGDRDPQHTTGGAVDLTLSWDGEPLALGTDYDAFSPEAAADAFEREGADKQIRLLRRGFAEAMAKAGFAPYRQEWWHWSYGDDLWAGHNGLDEALYDTFDFITFRPPRIRMAMIEQSKPGPYSRSAACIAGTAALPRAG